MSWEKFPKFLGKMTKGICKGCGIIGAKSRFVVPIEGK